MHKQYFIFENVFILGDSFFLRFFRPRIFLSVFFPHESVICIPSDISAQKFYLKHQFSISAWGPSYMY